MNRLRTRFVAFSMLTFSLVIAVLAVFIYLGAPAAVPPQRLLIGVLAALAMALLGSMTLSRLALKPVRVAWQRQLDFTADASHELRTPLATMRMNLELAMEHPEHTVHSQSKWLNNALVEAERMSGLVDALLTLSRGDAGAQTLSLDEISLNELLSAVASAFEPVARGKGIELCVACAETIILYADAARIHQLLAILLDNAVKYTPEPGGVELRVRSLGNRVEIAVTDTGTGIEPEYLGKVFDRFYRTDACRDQNADGFGLGLSIAQWIVHEHGGEIRAQSAPGGGARFVATLPLNRR